MRTKHTTLRIQKRPPQRQHTALLWLGRLGIFVGCIAVIGTAAVLGAMSYGQSYALEKIQALGQRAGLEIRVGSVVLQPGSYIELQDIEVRDPSDGHRLLTADRVTTDLTLTALRQGHRRPRTLLVTGCDLDVSDVERWKEAVTTYRNASGQRKTAARKGSSLLPDVLFVDLSVTLPDQGQSITRATGVSGQLKKRSTSDGTWDVAVAGASDTGQRFSMDATLDRKTLDVELGATFEPPLHIQRGDSSATVEAFAILGTRAIRASNIRLAHKDTQFTADYIQLGSEGGGNTEAVTSLLKDAVVVHVHGLQSTHNGVESSASSVRTTFRADHRTDDSADIFKSTAGNLLENITQRLQAVTAQGVSVRVPEHRLRLDADRALIVLRDTLRPRHLSFTQIESIRLEGSDTIAALPSVQTLRSLPYYQELRRLLRGETSNDNGLEPDVDPPALEPPPEEHPTAGGGPVMPAVPATAQLVELPTLEVKDSTLQLTYPDQDQAAFLIGALHASVTRGTDTLGAMTATIGGQIQELATGEQGKFTFSAEVDDTGRIAGGRVSVSGRKLAHVLAGVDEHIRVSDDSWLSVQVNVTPHTQDSGISATGKISVRNMGFEAHRIHGSPVDGIALDAAWSAKIYPDEHRLELSAKEVRLMEAGSLRIHSVVENLDRKLPKLTLNIEVPKQDCNHLVRSIPPAMVPRLDGLILDGTMEGRLEVSVDLEKPRTYKHTIEVDLQRCRPMEYGRTDVSKLNRSFVHDVVEKGEAIGVTVGPGTWHYRRLHRIPEYVQMGALATEDHSFFKHSGFRPSLIRRAVVMNLEGGRYVYGGSTITQQLVKNLFLSREKTLTRKLEEAIIVWMVENAVSKKRILELYLNCIEYGPKLYGLENAARAYFGKHVEELNALDSAFLMGLKPYPWAGWKQFERGYVKPWWHKRLKKILTGMARSGWITQEQLEASSSWEPVFLTSPNRVVTPPPTGPEPVVDDTPTVELQRPADPPQRTATEKRKAPLEDAPLRERLDAPLDPDAPPAMPNDDADDRPEPLLP